MIFITGGSGLVGSHLLYYLLLQGKSVKALVQSENSKKNVLKTFEYYTDNAQTLFNKIEWIIGTINDTELLNEALQGVKQVYHCAAIVSFNAKDAALIQQINVEGTANIVDACLQQNIEKLCHISSSSAFGKTKEDVMVTEEDGFVASPENSIYGISKYGAEREVWRGAAEGLNVVIVNPVVIIGSGNWNSGSSNSFTSAYKGMLFTSNGVTGFVDVRDVAQIMIKLMDSDITKERFILCSENLTYQEFFNKIHEGFNKAKPKFLATPFLAAIAWRLEKIKSMFTGENPLITKETANAGLTKSTFSNKKIKDTLNYNFIPISQSIKDTCELFLKDKKH